MPNSVDTPGALRVRPVSLADSKATQSRSSPRRTFPRSARAGHHAPACSSIAASWKAPPIATLTESPDRHQHGFGPTGGKTGVLG